MVQFFDAVKFNPGQHSGLDAKLGFGRIYVGGSDFRLVGAQPGQAKGAVIEFKGNENAAACIRNGAKAIIPAEPDMWIKHKFEFGLLREFDCAILIAASVLENANGFYRPKVLYSISKIIKAARASKADIGLISLASRPEELLSSMQLLEIGMLVGLSELEAKTALSKVNRKALV